MMRQFFLFLVLSSTVSSAQTLFIPDAHLRDWLNTARPGSVDANGYCDTAAWNAQGLYTLTLSAAGLADGTAVDLEGLQYLKIYKVILQGAPPNTVYMQWPGYPLNIHELHVLSIDVSAITGPMFPLSDQLDLFECKTCGLHTIPAFSGYNMIFRNEDLSNGGFVVPDSVTSLEMSYCSLTGMPVMPSVTHLNVDNNFMTIADWSNLPAGLEYLSAVHVGAGLPSMWPSGLQVLYIGANYPTSLPPLPSTLVLLNVSFNSLTSLPPLPAAMQDLSIDYGQFTAVPQLPSGIRALNVGGNLGVTSLPSLAGFTDLRTLYVHQTAITEVPPLPEGLLNMDVFQCDQLMCLPALPSTLLSLDVTGSGITCFPNLPAGLVGDDLGIPPVVCNVVNTLCPLAEPLISGTTFNDANSNGVLNFGEQPRPNGMVAVQPGDLLAGSDMNGRYVLPADIGAFTLQGVPSLYHPITTAPYAITFTALGQVDSMNNVGFSAVPGIYDLATAITCGQFRPGFNTDAWVTVRNVGTMPTSANVLFTLDGAQVYVSSTVVPDQVNGEVVQWSLPFLAPDAIWQARVTVYTPALVVIGTPLTEEAIATPDQPDQTPTDNVSSAEAVAVGSYDPNDKRVAPTTLSPQEVTDGRRVEYTIRFQNTGTYPAGRVLITDTLSSDLQVLTVQEVSSSHENRWFIRDHVLHVLFESINLPDSVGDEENSHGFVRFSFVPVSSLTLGESVSNTANIYFDFNAPVITNTAMFSVDASTGFGAVDGDDLGVWPNPTSGVLHFQRTVPFGLISITDVTGRVRMVLPVTARAGNIDVTALAPGCYFVQVDGGRAVRFVKR